MAKKLFKLHDRSLLGYFNYFGVIFFSFLIILTLIFYHNKVDASYLSLYSSISIYMIGTANINRCILPYGKQQPGLVAISNTLLLKHLFFTITKGYALQLFLAFLISLTYILVLKEYLVVIFSLGVIVISFLSQLTSILVKLIIRLTFLLQLWLILKSLIIFSIILLIIQLFIIFIYLNNYYRMPSGVSFLKKFDNSYITGSMTRIFLLYAANNKILLILLGIIASLILYFGQYLLSNVPGISALIIIYINFITVLEILIGSNREEIMIDKSRVETIQSSLIVSPYKRFKASSIYLYSLALILIAIMGLIGIILSNSDITVIIKSVLSIPIILLIGIVYYRKTELLLIGNESKILKFTLPILILILTILFTIGSKGGTN